MDLQLCTIDHLFALRTAQKIIEGIHNPHVIYIPGQGSTHCTFNAFDIGYCRLCCKLLSRLWSVAHRAVGSDFCLDFKHIYQLLVR